MSSSILLLIPGFTVPAVVSGGRSSSTVNCTDWRTTVDLYGARLFMIGDRVFQFPKTMQQLEETVCPRLTEAGEQLKDVMKACLKPFPKTVAGMITRGARKVNRADCNVQKEKEAFVQKLACMQPRAHIDELHEVVDKFTVKLSVIKRSVPDDKKIDVTCCEYLKTKRAIEESVQSHCPAESVSFTMGLVDGMLQEAVDFLCSQYLRDGSKCLPLLAAHPATVRPEDKKEGLSFMLPLIDVLTAAAGSSPDA